MKALTNRIWGLTLLAALGALGACQGQKELIVPTAEEVQALYSYSGRLEVEMSGNVAEITVYQNRSQLRRGGTLWARVGPYIFLFSDPTRQAFESFSGLAGVRVVTRTGSDQVAEALLLRDALNHLTWRRSLNISGRARRDGTASPSLLEELIRWGEDHTDHEYNPAYTRR